MTDNAAMALAVIRTIEERDVEGLLALCADDVELHDAPSLPYGGTTRGDLVTVRYRTRAISPSGERFESPVMALYEIRDGKFARAQMFHYDTAAILAFLRRAGTLV